MAKYRKVDTKIWNDRKFNSLSAFGKLAFLFILTHPNMTPLGAMRGTIEGLFSELKEVPLKAFKEAFAKPFIKYSERDCFIWLPNFLKYNQPESPNVVKSWAGSWDALPECQLKDELFIYLKGYTEALTEGFRKAFVKAIPKTMPNQEQEQEQDKEKEKEKEKENKSLPRRNFNEKEFLVFYSAYPNPVSKKDAIARWKKLLKTGELPELSIILAAIKKQILWRKNANGEFRPEWKHPATWLNKGCWEDEGGNGQQQTITPPQTIHQESVEDMFSNE